MFKKRSKGENPYLKNYLNPDPKPKKPEDKDIIFLKFVVFVI